MLPVSEGGANSNSFSSGKSGLICCQLVILPSDLAFHIVSNSLIVRHLAKLFSLLTTTARPSRAIGSSINSIPLSAHFLISSSLMVREAPAISRFPAQNLLNPPPVPLAATLTWALGLSFWYSSATGGGG